MSNGREYESPRIKLISTRLAPPAELARWLMERQSIPYEEEIHAPVFHARRSRRYGVGVELPVMVWPEKATAGVMALLDSLDERGRIGERLWGEGEQKRRNTREVVEFFHANLFLAVNLFYFYTLPDRSAMIEPAVHGAPFWERACVWAFYPLWRRVMHKGLKLDWFDPAAAVASISEVFDYVVGKVSGAGPFLAGQAPGTADIAFAALASPVVFPAKYGGTLPVVEGLPAELKAIIARFREHPAGRLVDAIYSVARPTPQPLLRAQSNPFSFTALLTGPWTLRAGGWALRTFAPRLRLGSNFIVSRWADVAEVLDRDTDFLIAPINAARITAVSGPFMLGMDRSPELTQQRETSYGALRSMDMGPVRAVIDTEPRRVLELFAARFGRIDVVNSYARIVAARTAVALFGIRGPTEQDLMRVSRAVFQETFLNIGDDPAVKARALAAGRELAQWIDAEVADRRARGVTGTDMLGRLLAAQEEQGFVAESVRWMLAGFLIGAIETTATATANIIQECVADCNLVENMARDLDNPQRFLGWCWEALRRRPHNPILFRQAAAGVDFHGKILTADTRVIAFTLAAMFDPAAFNQPGRSDPTRPLDHYVHFGRGMHICGGRDINAIQIPALVRELVRFGVSFHARVQDQGPFPDVLVVALKTVSR
jgi:cytochrome P450